MEHIYLEIIQVISTYCSRCNFSLFYLQVVDKVENTLGSGPAKKIGGQAYPIDKSPEIPSRFKSLFFIATPNE